MLKVWMTGFGGSESLPANSFEIIYKQLNLLKIFFMSDILNYDDQAKPKLPTGLNVLTILTFIWSAYELYSAIKNFMGGSQALADMDKAQEKMANAPDWVKKMAGPEARDMLIKTIDNKIPLLVISLAAIALCVYGAIEMRKQKKQGYILWLIGEILPFIGTAIFLPEFFSTIFVIFIIFPVIFILLYALQRKHLKY